MRKLLRGLALAIALAAPGATLADVTPLSRLMLGNLQAINALGESLAIEDYAGVESVALDLRNRAREMQGWDVSKLGFSPSNRAAFDAYLKLQEEISGGLGAAARGKDAAAIVAGLDDMFGRSCLACHRDFRDREQRLRASTMFMTSFVSAWKESNRGLMLNDFALVARSARVLVTMGQIMSWDPVLQASFNLQKEAQRDRFREHLQRLIGAAGRIEDAAARGEPEAARKALAEMWSGGCLACHREFR